jgi:hypothetical protein
MVIGNSRRPFAFCAVSTKTVITLDLEAQKRCRLLRWNEDLKRFPAKYLWTLIAFGIKSYDVIFRHSKQAHLSGTCFYLGRDVLFQ